jgi:hypothetical protein
MGCAGDTNRIPDNGAKESENGEKEENGVHDEASVEGMITPHLQ